jgi:hypothetical protein
MNGIGWLEAEPQIDEIKPRKLFLLYLTLLYLPFFYASVAKTAKPICTHDGSNEEVCCKEMPSGGRVDRKLRFGVKTPEKSPILELGCQTSSQINTHE